MSSDPVSPLLYRQNLRRQCYFFIPERRQREKFGAEPNSKVNKNYRVSLELVVLLRSTHQRIKLGLTRGHKSAHRPPVCLHNRGERFSSHDTFTFST